MLSRLVSAHPSSLDPEDFCCYEPNLYLQGFVVVSVCGCVWVCVCGCVGVGVWHRKQFTPQTPFTVFTHYQPHTFYYCQTSEITKCWGLHTYTHTQSGESSYLPFTMADIRQSDLPPCIIHISGTCKEVIKHTIHYVSTLSLSLSCVCPNAHCVIWCCVLYKVRWVEMNIPYFIRVKEEMTRKTEKGEHLSNSIATVIILKWRFTLCVCVCVC